MLELHQLEQLVAIADHGTISAAAEALHLSQPALTRSVQRLEDKLSVRLFQRGRNRVLLSPVGELAVARAREILRQAELLEREVHSAARRQSTIPLGSMSPAPLWTLAAELGERFPGHTISTELQDAENLKEGLHKGLYRLILMDQPLRAEGILCGRYVDEQLCAELPAGHPLSGKSTLRWSDLAGQTVLVYEELGLWSERLTQVKDVRFVMQRDRESMRDLLRSTQLPSLASSIRGVWRVTEPGRVCLPIEEKDTRVSFYLCAAEADRDLISRILPEVSEP